MLVHVGIPSATPYYDSLIHFAWATVVDVHTCQGSTYTAVGKAELLWPHTMQILETHAQTLRKLYGSSKQNCAHSLRFLQN
eukprot:3088979-Amphidinium_carterae.1